MDFIKIVEFGDFGGFGWVFGSCFGVTVEVFEGFKMVSDFL